MAATSCWRLREKVAADGDSWRHVKIRLVPNNRDFKVIELKAEDEDAVGVVAELVEVLG